MTASVGCCGGGSATGGAYALPATTPATPAVFNPSLSALSVPSSSPTSIATLGAGTIGTPAAASVGGGGAGGTSTVVGHIVSADNSSVVMRLKDGTTKTYAVRPEDLGKVNPGHLQGNHTKAGAPDISMTVTTIGGVEYAGAWKHAS